MKGIPNRQKKNVVPRRDFDRGQWERIRQKAQRRQRKTKRQPSVAICSIEDKTMTTLTVELPPEAYQRLREEADRLGKAPPMVAQE